MKQCQLLACAVPKVASWFAGLCGSKVAGSVCLSLFLVAVVTGLCDRMQGTKGFSRLAVG
jgi:hypothetical protein